MIKALVVSAQEDLQEFLDLLNWNGISYQLETNHLQKVIFVSTERDHRKVVQLFNQFSQSERKTQAPTVPVVNVLQSLQKWQSSFKRLPISWFVVILCFIGYILFSYPVKPAVFLFTFYTEYGTPPQMQIWRWLTPIFLHAGLMHFIFNALFFWVWGQQIEKQQGRLALLFLVIVAGLGGNLLQVIMTPGMQFVGLSGVVYGVMGYIVAWNYYQPYRQIIIIKALVLFFMAWLLLGVVGVFSLFGMDIANGAHIGGLLSGLMLGAIIAKFKGSYD